MLQSGNVVGCLDVCAMAASEPAAKAKSTAGTASNRYTASPDNGTGKGLAAKLSWQSARYQAGSPNWLTQRVLNPSYFRSSHCQEWAR
jgi:hypothetical protein